MAFTDWLCEVRVPAIITASPNGDWACQEPWCYIAQLSHFSDEENEHLRS